MQTSLPKILITGGSGQIAQAILHHQRSNQFQLIACSRAELDITNINSIQNGIQLHKPDVVINTAAYTAVDKAETEQELAMRVNHLGAKNLALICQNTNTPLIHLSTDYIFDGTAKNPYLENDQANPINFYGLSKWRGEEAIRELCEQHIILRVSGVFSEYGNNFVKTILRLAAQHKEIRVVNDQITCPTYAGDIAGAIFEIIRHRHCEELSLRAQRFSAGRGNPATWQARKVGSLRELAMTNWGTYHFCSFPAVSWYEFAQLLIKTIRPISTGEFASTAKRPAYSVLDCQKIKNILNINQPPYNEKIIHDLKQFKVSSLS